MSKKITGSMFSPSHAHYAFHDLDICKEYIGLLMAGDKQFRNKLLTLANDTIDAEVSMKALSEAFDRVDYKNYIKSNLIQHMETSGKDLPANTGSQ